MKRLLHISLILLPTILLTACGLTLAQDITPPPGYTPPAPPATVEDLAVYPLVPPDPQNGMVLYQENCAACHGKTGKGDGSRSADLPVAPGALGLVNIARNATPQEWFKIVSNGIPGSAMPGLSTALTERQRWDIVSYSMTLSNTAEELVIGEQIFQAMCVDCHGEAGRGNGPQAKTLPLQPPDFSNQSLLSTRSSERLFQVISGGASDVMPAFANQLTDDERWAVTGFIRQLSFSRKTFSSQPTETATIEPTGTGSNTPDPALLTQTPSSVGASPTPGSSSQPAINTIQGFVINDSGGQIPAGELVTLRGYDDMQEVIQQTAVVQVDGSYRFGQVDMPAGRIFIVSIEHQGEVFNSAPSLHPGEEQILVDGILQLSIHISDQSTDASALYVERMHVFLDFSIPGTVQIVELFLITNPTNSIITASDPAIGVISFDLPKGAQNLQFQDSVLGERYLPTENGFSDTQVIQPGPASHQVLFAYEFPYNGSLDLSIPLPMPVNTVSLMVPFEGIKVKSDQLADGGLKDSQGMSFHLYTAANLASSSPLEFSVTGKVKTTGAQSGIQVNGILFGAGLFVLALTGVGYFFYRKMRPVEKEESRSESKNKDEIMDAIIALDDLHKSGKLSSEAYQQRRNELKSRLKEIL